MEGLELHIKHDGEIVVPTSLFDLDLSPSELLAVLMLQAVGEGEYDANSLRLTEPDMKDATESLHTRGILTGKLVGNKLSLVLDLENVSQRKTTP